MREVICNKILPALGILLVVGSFFLCFVPPLNEKGDELLEPLCTQTLPGLFPDNLPNLSEMYVHWDFSKIQTGTFPR
jgi:hypothetical protein